MVSLAEDYSFAEKCEESGFKFIGPTSETIKEDGRQNNCKNTG